VKLDSVFFLDALPFPHFVHIRNERSSSQPSLGFRLQAVYVLYSQNKVTLFCSGH
jgi:hypothetical protein